MLSPHNQSEETFKIFEGRNVGEDARGEKNELHPIKSSNSTLIIPVDFDQLPFLAGLASILGSNDIFYQGADKEKKKTSIK